MSDRGQVFSADLIAAATIFSIGAAYLVYNHNTALAHYTDGDLNRRIGLMALRSAEILVKTSGYPNNWEVRPGDANISSIGLARHDRELDKAKLSGLGMIPEKRLDELLGGGVSHAKVVVRQLAGKPLASVGQANQRGQYVRVVRIAECENKTVLVELTLTYGTGGDEYD